MTPSRARIFAELFPSLWRLLRVAAALVLLSCASVWLDDASFLKTGISIVWLTNGFLIGVLLRSPRRQWPCLLSLGLAVDLGLNLQLTPALPTSLFLSFCNSAEVLLASWLMSRAVAAAPDLTEAAQMRSLLLYGVGVAPLVCSLMASLCFHFLEGEVFLHHLRSWLGADALGNATVLPLYLSRFSRSRPSPRGHWEVAGLYLLLGIVTLAVFYLSSLPLLWCVLLALMVLGVRLGFTAAALGLILVMYAGGVLTIAGRGPLGAGGPGTAATRMLALQAFLGAAMVTIYLTDVALAAKRKVMRRLENSEARFRSLAEASRDAIILTALDGRQEYVSPAMTELTGWTPEQLLGQDMHQIVHPDDLLGVRQYEQSLLAARPVKPLVYRRRRRDGSWVWLEGNARLLRDEHNQPAGYVLVVRDISDRKAAEERIQSAYRNAESMAMTDGLTGLPNRRLLDRTLERQWASSRRDGTPLSLLLIDIDYFKLFNDGQGHLRGDECLRRVAEAMKSVLQRPLDLLARFGGEEFIAVLPNTPPEGAQSIAEALRTTVETACIPHAGSPYGMVTVSIGGATKVPAEETGVLQLLDRADTALYQAKSHGRNQTRCVSGATAVTGARTLPAYPLERQPTDRASLRGS